MSLHSYILYSLGKTPTHPPLSLSRSLTSVHWGKPLHAFGLTSVILWLTDRVALQNLCKATHLYMRLVTFGVRLMSPHTPTQSPPPCGYPWLELPILQPWDTMSLRKADMGSVCVMRAIFWINSSTPTEPPCIPSSRASALESETRSESKNAFSAVLSTEGRVVGLCWEHLKPKGPKGSAVPRLTLTETSRSPCVFAQLHYVHPGQTPYTSTFLSHFGWLLGVELLYNIYVKQLDRLC